VAVRCVNRRCPTIFSVRTRRSFSAMRTLADRVRLGDPSSERGVELAEIVHDEPVHPQPVRVPRDAGEGCLPDLLGEIQETAQMLAAWRDTREASNGSLVGDRRLRDGSFVRAAVHDELLERFEQCAYCIRFVAQVVLDSPHPTNGTRPRSDSRSGVARQW
jgi:hypothetical protein